MLAVCVISLKTFAAHAMNIFNKVEILQAMSAVKAERKRVIRGFANDDMGPLIQKALNALVESGNKMLREKKFDSAAAQFETEWNHVYAFAFDGFSPMDLGDHKPVFEWLADYYNTLEDKLGKELCIATHLVDIKAINFGAPVAIFPKGDPRTGEKYDMVEYRNHFVPFTTAVLYWSMKIACSATLSAVPSIICSSVAEMPRDGYEIFVAPYLSDYLFKKRTGFSALVNLSNFEM